MNTGHVQGRNPHPSGWGGGQYEAADEIVASFPNPLTYSPA